MINIKDHKSGYLWDQWAHLGDKRRNLLEESWAGTFRQHVLLQLPVEKLIPFFSVMHGRPTKELYSALGALLLQQMHDLTDKETIEQFSFNIQWHYALNITGVGDDETYLSLRTLWNLRKIIHENEIDQVLFESITDHILKTFSVDTDKQRIDSVHIRSNMRKLGRIRIIAAAIKKFLVNLKRHYPERYIEVPEAIRNRFKDDKSLSVFSLVKPSEAQSTLSQVAGELYSLAKLFANDDEIQKMTSFSMLMRVLREQCDVGDEGDVSPKPAKKISSDSLQNPSDPDATYDGHKGQGYQVQVTETWSETSEAENENKQKNLEIITQVKVEKAHESDAHALIPAIIELEERNILPAEILADSLYGSDDNLNQAKQHGVDVVSPTMGKEDPENISLADFNFSDQGELIGCPGGSTPTKCKRKKDRNTVIFEMETCSACPHQDRCPAKRGKKYFYLRYTDKELRLSRRRKHEKSDEFRDRYRYRAGVEATMSAFDRLTRVKKLRVRGFGAVRFCATLKALAVNIYRLTAYLNEASADDGPESPLQNDSHGTCSALKGLFISILGKIRPRLRIFHFQTAPQTAF